MEEISKSDLRRLMVESFYNGFRFRGAKLGICESDGATYYAAHNAAITLAMGYEQIDISNKAIDEDERSGGPWPPAKVDESALPDLEFHDGLATLVGIDPLTGKAFAVTGRRSDQTDSKGGYGAAPDVEPYMIRVNPTPKDVKDIRISFGAGGVGLMTWGGAGGAMTPEEIERNINRRIAAFPLGIYRHRVDGSRVTLIKVWHEKGEFRVHYSKEHVTDKAIGSVWLLDEFEKQYEYLK